MGKLVPFDKRRRPERSRAAKATDEAGQVLIFTGVRYERDPTTPVTTNGTTPARPKRKRG